MNFIRNRVVWTSVLGLASLVLIPSAVFAAESPVTDRKDALMEASERLDQRIAAVSVVVNQFRNEILAPGDLAAQANGGARDSFENAMKKLEALKAQKSALTRMINKKIFTDTQLRSRMDETRDDRLHLSFDRVFLLGECGSRCDDLMDESARAFLKEQQAPPEAPADPKGKGKSRTEKSYEMLRGKIETLTMNIEELRAEEGLLKELLEPKSQAQAVVPIPLDPLPVRELAVLPVVAEAAASLNTVVSTATAPETDSNCEKNRAPTAKSEESAPALTPAHSDDDSPLALFSKVLDLF